MAALLTREQWETLRRLYIAGKKGILADRAGYGKAGPWPILMYLRDYDPPLAREVLRSEHGGHYAVVITDAGAEFYEHNERMYDVFYPPVV